MDEIEIQRQQIMQSLNTIYSILVQGSQTETTIAGLLFIAYDNLKHYWYDLPQPKQTKQKDDIDKIEWFLHNIADLD